MKQILLSFLLLFFSFNIFANTKSDSLKNELNYLREQITLIESAQKYQSEQINSQTSMLDTAFDGISAEIGASSNFIGIFGIIIALFSIGLSIYVSRIEKNVRTMTAEGEALHLKSIEIKQDIENLSNKITNDVSSLYNLIRNEESNQMIDRLISVPEDIHNLFSNLASRDLEKEHFSKMKEAFLQLNEKDDGYSDYITLFFQHFSDLSLLDKDIKPKFMKSIASNFSNAFKNDAIKSANDFFSAIQGLSISKTIKDINDYVGALCKSPFSEVEEIYFKINNVIIHRENKFELYDCISKTPDYLPFRKNCGKLLLDYNYDNLTPKEEAIINEIKIITK